MNPFLYIGWRATQEATPVNCFKCNSHLTFLSLIYLRSFISTLASVQNGTITVTVKLQLYPKGYYPAVCSQDEVSEACIGLVADVNVLIYAIGVECKAVGTLVGSSPASVSRSITGFYGNECLTCTELKINVCCIYAVSNAVI